MFLVIPPGRMAFRDVVAQVPGKLRRYGRVTSKSLFYAGNSDRSTWDLIIRYLCNMCDGVSNPNLTGFHRCKLRGDDAEHTMVGCNDRFTQLGSNPDQTIFEAMSYNVPNWMETAFAVPGRR